MVIWNYYVNIISLNMKRIYLILFCLLCIIACNRQQEQQQQQQQPIIKNSPGIFTDITKQSGLNFVHEPGVDGSYFMPESMGSGGALFDYDQDGDLDILLINGAWHG